MEWAQVRYTFNYTNEGVGMKIKMWILLIALLLLPNLAWGATYTIGPGQTYTTFTLLVATETLAADDIVDGGGNTFTETWTPDGSGTEGHPIIIRNATITGSDSRDYGVYNTRSWITFSNLTISNVVATGIYSYANGTTLTGITVDGCTISAPKCVGFGGTGTRNYVNLTVTDNTLTPGVPGGAESGYYGIGVDSGNAVTTFNFSGNTISGTEDAIAIAEGGTDSGGVISNNILGGNTENSIDCKYCRGVTISGNTMTDDTEQGMVVHEVGGASASCIIENNVITGSDSHGIDVRGLNHIVRYNKVSNSGLDGIRVTVTSNGTQVYYNIVNTWGIANLAAGIRIAASTGVHVYNNTVWDSGTSGEWGIWFTTSSTGGQVFNNITKVSYTHLRVDDGSQTDFDSDYNMFYDDTADRFEWIGTRYTFANWKTQSSQDANSTIDDPEFVSASNFHLQAASPCRDKGVAVGLTRDYDNVSVPCGSAVDIGAFEFISGGGGLDLHLDIGM